MNIQPNYFLQLKIYLAEEHPDLHAELGPMNFEQVRIRLNEVTGLDVPSTSGLDEGSKAYLERFFEMYGDPQNGQG